MQKKKYPNPELKKSHQTWNKEELTILSLQTHSKYIGTVLKIRASPICQMQRGYYGPKTASIILRLIATLHSRASAYFASPIRFNIICWVVG